MKFFYYVFLTISIAIVLSIVYVYVKYKGTLVFAPDIFMTEMFKFGCLTVLWTFILQYYHKLNSLKKKESSINILLLSNIKLIIEKIENEELEENELKQFVNLIYDNIQTINTKLSADFSPEELNQFSLYGKSLINETFVKAIEKVEYSIKFKTGYKNLDEYFLIIKQLTQLVDVFENKKK